MGGEAIALADKSWLYHPDYPDHWERCPLYSLAEWVNGLAFRDIQFSPSGMPVIKIAEIKGGISGQTKFTQQSFDESVRVRPGDLLFSWSGQPETSIDAFWWRGPEGWLNQHVFRVTPADGIDPTFFYYLLRYLKPNFVGIARNKQTTGLGHVTKRDLENMEAAYPELPEQRAIAHILGTLDDKIELNRRQNKALEAIARRLFKSWFVDFDPVRAKAAGEKPPGLADDLAALFPDRFVDSELGEIPEGWQQSTLGAVASLNPETWTTRKHPDEIDYLDLSNVKDGVIEAPTRYSWDDAPSRARRVLQRGDTIIGTVRPGNRSFALIDEAGLTGSTGFAVLRPLNEVNREFLYIASTSDDAIERLAHLADGAAYPAVRPEVVLATEIVMPTEEVMAAFSAVTKNIFDLASICRQESKVLASIRDLLLPRLISGKLRVGETKSLIEEAIA